MSIEVSTITPCYRMKDYIEFFLESLPKQTFFNRMEVVLDHNEPEKKEIELVRKFQNKYPGRLKHIIVKKVDPIGVSMNRCIYNSKGKFLTIWNVDDLRTDNSIELEYNKIINSKFEFAYGNYTIVKIFGSKAGKFINHEKFDVSELTKSMILGPFFMFKKSLCNKIGFFDEQLIQGTDFDFAIRLALASKGTMVSENLGYYLNAQKGLSTKKNSLQPIEANVIYMRYGIFSKIKKRMLADMMKYNLKSFIFNKKEISIKKFIPNYEEYLAKQISIYKNRFFEKFF
jgi:glycosyltransferase involved in cell wall biosynthesis